MSQKSSPRSPRTPRSKSPSCDEGQQGGEKNIEVDEIQEAVAEELRSPDRIISQGPQSPRNRAMSPAQGSGPSYHGTASPSRAGSQPGTARQSRGSFQGAGAQSRVSYHPSVPSRPPTAPQSRTPSPRGASTCEEEPPRLPSPPLTPGTYGSRAASLGAGRAASPEAASQRSKPISFQEMAQAPEPNEDYCPEDQAPAPDSTYVRGPSQPSMRTTPAPSHPSMRGSPAYSHPSMRGSPAYSHPSVRGSPAYSHPSMREEPAYSHPSRAQMIGASQASVRQTASGYPSMREGTLPSDRGTLSGMMASGVGPSVVTFGNKESMPYVQEASSPKIGSPQRTMHSAMGGTPVCSKQTVDDMEAGMSGVGPIPSGVAPMRMDVGTSVMSYAPQSERSAGMAGCVPGCKTFMRDIQNAASSTPYGGTAPPRQEQFPCPRQQPMMSPVTGGGRIPQHQGMPHDSGYMTFSAPAAPPTFTRGGPAPPMRPPPSPSDGEHHHHHHHDGDDEGHEGPPEPDERVVAALGHLSQFKKTPSYFRCGVGQDLDFLKVCGGPETVKSGPGPGQVAAFPEIPCLRQEDIDELVKCETADVESAWFLTSDERKTYKKPCPKQQKAQMTVKALVQAHEKAQTCGKEYSPLEHPDPEDISPEVAAAMMFSQEKGIKMEECPHYTITNLFPDEPKTPFPEKIPASSISIVDRSSKDQEEMIEKSASVPSEGVSDSAYTRTMKEKGSEDVGAQRSFDVDFAIGQSKREYVLVTEKPQRINRVQYRGGNSPPWFPGYFSAFPNEEGIKTVASPSDLLYKAWIHSNPKNMPTSDVIVLD